MPFNEIYLNGGLDYNPASFTIITCNGVTPGVSYTSQSITPTEYNAPSRFCVDSGFFCISDGNGFRPHTCVTCILPGQTFVLCGCIPSGCFDGTCTINVRIGGNDNKSPTCSSWTFSARSLDTVPNSFSLCAFTNTTPNCVSCGVVLLTGFDCSCACVTSGMFACYPCASVSGGFTTGTCVGLCASGYFMCYSLCGPTNFSTTCFYCLTVGGVTGTASVTTFTPPDVTVVNKNLLCCPYTWPGGTISMNVTDINTGRVIWYGGCVGTEPFRGCPLGCFDVATGFRASGPYFDSYLCKWIVCGRMLNCSKYFCSPTCAGTEFIEAASFSSSCGCAIPQNSFVFDNVGSQSLNAQFGCARMGTGSLYFDENASPPPGVVKLSTWSCWLPLTFCQACCSGYSCLCYTPNFGVTCNYNIFQKLYVNCNCKIAAVISMGLGGSGYVGLGIDDPSVCIPGLSPADNCGFFGCFPGFTGCARCACIGGLNVGRLNILTSSNGIDWTRTPTPIFIQACNLYNPNTDGSGGGIHNAAFNIAKAADGNWFLTFSRGSSSSNHILKCDCTCFSCPGAICGITVNSGTFSCNPNVVWLGPNLTSPCYCYETATCCSYSWSPSQGYTFAEPTYSNFRCAPYSQGCLHTCGPTIFFNNYRQEGVSIAYMNGKDLTPRICCFGNSTCPSVACASYYYSGPSDALYRLSQGMVSCICKLSTPCPQSSTACSWVGYACSNCYDSTQGRCIHENTCATIFK